MCLRSKLSVIVVSRSMRKSNAFLARSTSKCTSPGLSAFTTESNLSISLFSLLFFTYVDVAATGLPIPREDHALAMVRFAQNCLIRFHDLTNELELSLGPGTADLGLRVGLHSGPVTAGVLRGEKSRFQLFGDTMNTASRE